jgi:hypothetical protein
MIRELFSLKDRIRHGFGKGFSDGISLSPTVEHNMVAVLYGPDGKIKTVRRVHNTVKDAGKYGAADQLLASPTLAKPGWMELGTGSPAATLLGAYIASSRVALTSKLRTNAVVTMVGDWAANVGTGAITEAGLFDVATQNTVNMWLSASFSVINKGAADTFQITWTLTYA